MNSKLSSELDWASGCYGQQEMDRYEAKVDEILEKFDMKEIIKVAKEQQPIYNYRNMTKNTDQTRREAYFFEKLCKGRFVDYTPKDKRIPYDYHQLDHLDWSSPTFGADITGHPIWIPIILRDLLRCMWHEKMQEKKQDHNCELRCELNKPSLTLVGINGDINDGPDHLWPYLHYLVKHHPECIIKPYIDDDLEKSLYSNLSVVEEHSLKKRQREISTTKEEEEDNKINEQPMAKKAKVPSSSSS